MMSMWLILFLEVPERMRKRSEEDGNPSETSYDIREKNVYPGILFWIILANLHSYQKIQKRRS